MPLPALQTPWHMPVEEQKIAKGGAGSGVEYPEQDKDLPDNA